MSPIEKLRAIITGVRVVSALVMIVALGFAWVEASTPKGWLFIGTSLVSWVVYDVLESVKQWATEQPSSDQGEPK